MLQHVYSDNTLVQDIFSSEAKFMASKSYESKK